MGKSTILNIINAFSNHLTDLNFPDILGHLGSNDSTIFELRLVLNTYEVNEILTKLEIPEFSKVNFS